MPKQSKKPICKPDSRCKPVLSIEPLPEVERRCYNIVAKPERVCNPRTCVELIIEGDAVSEEAQASSTKFETPGDDILQERKSLCAQIFNISCIPTKREQRDSHDQSVGTDEIRRDEFGNTFDKNGNRIDKDGNLIGEDGGDGARAVGSCPCCKCIPCICGPKVPGGEGADGTGEVGGAGGAGGAEGWKNLGDLGQFGKGVGEGESCTCLPGLCVCPGGAAKRGKSKGEEARLKEVAEELRKGSDASIASCLCLHYEDVHYITPATTVHSVQTEAAPESVGTIICTCPRYQRTLAIIKPNAMVYKDAVIRAITQEGLDIVNRRIIHLTPEQVADIYEKQYGTPVFPVNIVKMSMAPSAVLSLAGIDAVRRWNNLVGPDKVLPEEWFFPASMRRLFNLPGEILDGVHASDSLELASNENRYFFPHDVLEPILMEKSEVGDYFKKYIHPTLSKGLTTIAKLKPRDPILYLAEWLVSHSPYRPHMTRAVALSPT